MNVGVLALQGASRPHVTAFARLGVDARDVRGREDLAALTHLVIPGGESTTIRHLLDLFEMSDEIVARARDGSLAIFGTCAGAILLGRDEGERPRRFGLLDVAFERNGYGTQVDSFAGPIDLAPSLGGGTFPGVFIRAPRIRDVGSDVEVLATRAGEPVLVRQGSLLAATFHPELGSGDRVHEYFVTEREAHERTGSPGA
jgi:pyridoxal 5'-phosphate synthase pdxT subunit